jgi:type III secretion protein J
MTHLTSSFGPDRGLAAGRSPSAGRARIVYRCTMAAAAITLLCSCQSELYSRVSERDANEILAALYTAGVSAGKSTRDQKTWSVDVEERDLQRALQIVSEHGLPREQFANTGDLFKKEGLISTPSEERFRYIYAVSQELSNTLSQIDGVIAARVHPVMPANDPLASQVRPSSASVFIKYRHDANLEAMAPAIKNLVMHSIEGLSYENISLTFVAAEEPAHRDPAPVTASPGPVRAAVGGMGTLLLLAFGGLGYWLLQRYQPDLAARNAMRTIREAGADNIAINTSEARYQPHWRSAWSLLRTASFVRKARGARGSAVSGEAP